MNKFAWMAVSAALTLGACGTDGNTTPGNALAPITSACILTKDIPAYEALNAAIPARASAGREAAVLAKADQLAALAEKASDTSNYVDLDQKLSCRFVEVQARATLAEVAFAPGGDPGAAAEAMTAVAEAETLCPVNTPDGKRECALLTEFYSPVLFSRSAVKQLDALTSGAGDAAVDWDAAESATHALTAEVSDNWSTALAAAKASKEAGVGDAGAAPYDLLSREYDALACLANRATTGLAKAAPAPENRLEDGALRDYDLRGQALRAQIVKALDLASTPEDKACYDDIESAACRLRLGNQVLSAFCADMLDAGES